MRKINLKFLSILIVFVSIVSNVFAASCSLEVVDNAIRDYNKDHKLNAVYLFENSSQTQIAGAVGYSSIEDKIPLKNDQRMPIASCTKPFTAAGILLLKDRGLIDLNQSISKYLPASTGIWPNNEVPEWADNITVHHLLTHSSGIPEYVLAHKMDPDSSLRDINKSIMAFACSKPHLFDAGQEYNYCNTNYVLLGLMIEEITKENLAEFFNKEFFKPLEMKDTSLASVEEALKYQKGELQDKYPVRYFVTPNGTEPIYNPLEFNYFLSPFADGGLISSTQDLVKWNKALHKGKVLSPESYNLMITPYYEVPGESLPTQIGYGMYITDLDNGNKLYHHGGRALAIRAEQGYMPACDMSFAILTNTMFYIPEDMKVSIDMTDPNYQLDIAFFRNAVLKAVSK